METQVYIFLGVVGINRNIVECKYKRQGESTGYSRELIETLWNVNTESAPQINSYSSELIETLWNVNPDLLPDKVRAILN